MHPIRTNSFKSKGDDANGTVYEHSVHLRNYQGGIICRILCRTAYHRRCKLRYRATQFIDRGLNYERINQKTNRGGSPR